MNGLSKSDLDYLVRTIMPELYEMKRKKDEYWDYLMKTLPECAPDVVTDSAINIDVSTKAVEKTRLSA